MRKNIKVKAFMNPNGEIVPLSVIWDDGREFEIDRILDVRKAPSKSGGFAIRYEVRISMQVRYLFLDEYVWFIDADDNSVTNK